MPRASVLLVTVSSLLVTAAVVRFTSKSDHVKTTAALRTGSPFECLTTPSMTPRVESSQVAGQSTLRSVRGDGGAYQ